MTDQTRWLIVNLDLDEDFFNAVVARFGDLSGFSDPTYILDTLSTEPVPYLREPLGLIILFARRLHAGLASVAPGLAALERLERNLEARQIKLAFRQAIFVDCGEIPNAPLSDFAVLGQYIEAFADTMSATRYSGVYALDAKRDKNDGWTEGAFVWWDTRSEAFVDHVRNYMMEALQNLNPGPPN
jgi:hypothetical protein